MTPSFLSRRPEAYIGSFQVHVTANFRESARDICVFTVKRYGGVKSANTYERIATNDKVATLKHGARVEYVMIEQMEEIANSVEAARECTVKSGEVVVDKRTGQCYELRISREPLGNGREPPWRKHRVGVDVRDNFAVGRVHTSGARIREPFFKLVDDAYAGESERNFPGAILGSVIDDHDLGINPAPLYFCEHRLQALCNDRLLIMGRY